MQKQVKRQFDWTSTSIIIWVTILLTATLMVLQYYFPEVKIPHEGMAICITVISGGYVGTDRIAGFIRTKMLAAGEADYGNTSRLLKMVYLLLLLVILSLVLEIFFKVQGLSTATLLAAYTGAAGSYAIGNKAIKAGANFSPLQPSTFSTGMSTEDEDTDIEGGSEQNSLSANRFPTDGEEKT